MTAAEDAHLRRHKCSAANDSSSPEQLKEPLDWGHVNVYEEKGNAKSSSPSQSNDVLKRPAWTFASQARHVMYGNQCRCQRGRKMTMFKSCGNMKEMHGQ